MNLTAVPGPAPAVSARPVASPSSAGAALLQAPSQRGPGEPPVSAPDNYYAAAQGKQGAELLRALHLITRNGHKDLGYSQARDGMFALVDDPTDTNVVEDIYSGRKISNVAERKSAYSRGMNAEHTWPQSKGATGIAQSDLHQVMPSDIHTNSMRSSYPYGEVEQVEWSNEQGPESSVLGRDASGATVFEPRDKIKGDIARGLLYFYTRYNMSRPEDYTLENFRKELPTLLNWHKTDPVDDREKRRNDAVFAQQHNRNPYIDHPEWVDAVNFPSQPLQR